jgi:hypothetical protein
MTDEGVAFLLIPYRCHRDMDHHKTHPHCRGR